MRVLSIDDLNFNDKGGSLYMVYQQQKETLARMYQGGTLRRPRNSGDSMSDSLATRSGPGAARADLAGAQPVHRRPAATTASTRPRSAPPTARRSSTCSAASCRRPIASSSCRSTSSLQGERLDNIAAAFLGDPELFWRLSDANGAMRPEELVQTVGTQASHHAARRHHGVGAVNRGFYLTLMMGSVQREPGAAAPSSTR